MRPTVDEQLAGIDRLLEQIGADPDLGSESALLLGDARRQLGRLRGSLEHRLPFLRWDNAASLAVLRAAEPHLPDDLRARIELLAAQDDQVDRPADESRAAERNDAIRSLLGDAIDTLGGPGSDPDPDPEPGDGPRRTALRRIVEHLRTRTAANPALNKNPTIPDPPTSSP